MRRRLGKPNSHKNISDEESTSDLLAHHREESKKKRNPEQIPFIDSNQVEDFEEVSSHHNSTPEWWSTIDQLVENVANLTKNAKDSVSEAVQSALASSTTHENAPSSSKQPPEVSERVSHQLQDVNEPKCFGCKEEFGLLRRSYKCPNCNHKFCYYCLPSQFTHRIPRLRVVEPTVVCEMCYYRICVQTCGGKCFSNGPISLMKEFLRKHHVDFTDCVEKQDLVRKINDWGKIDRFVQGNDIPNPVPMSSLDGGVQYLSVKELRKIMDTMNLDHSDCIEKGDMISKILDKMKTKG